MGITIVDKSTDRAGKLTIRPFNLLTNVKLNGLCAEATQLSSRYPGANYFRSPFLDHTFLMLFTVMFA